MTPSLQRDGKMQAKGRVSYLQRHLEDPLPGFCLHGDNASGAPSPTAAWADNSVGTTAGVRTTAGHRARR